MISQFVCVWEMFFPVCILFFIFIFDVSLWENSWSIKICSILLNLLWINNILVNQCRKCLFNFMNFVIKGHFLCGWILYFNFDPLLMMSSKWVRKTKLDQQKPLTLPSNPLCITCVVVQSFLWIKHLQAILL